MGMQNFYKSNLNNKKEERLPKRYPQIPVIGAVAPDQDQLKREDDLSRRRLGLIPISKTKIVAKRLSREEAAKTTPDLPS